MSTQRILWIATAIIIIITFFAAYHKIQSGPHILALHYNVIVGVDVLGNKNRLYQIPLTAVIISIVNIVLIRTLRLRDNLFPVVLAAISLFSATALLAATLFLYGVN